MKSPSAAPNPFQEKPVDRNSLKIQALKVFENRGWLNPPVWAALAGFYPVRSSYSYLLRLHRMRLLDRGLDANRLILYHISKRGVERLKWLRNST